MLSVLAEQIQHLSHDPEQGPARAAELVSQAADLALQEDLIATSLPRELLECLLDSFGAWVPLGTEAPSRPLLLLGEIILDVSPKLMQLGCHDSRVASLLLPALLRAAAEVASPREMLTALLEALGEHSSSCCDGPAYLLMLSLLPLLPPLLSKVTRRRLACALEVLGPIEELAAQVGPYLWDVAQPLHAACALQQQQQQMGPRGVIAAARASVHGSGCAGRNGGEHDEEDEDEAERQRAARVAGRVMVEPFVVGLEGVWRSVLLPEMAKHQEGPPGRPVAAAAAGAAGAAGSAGAVGAAKAAATLDGDSSGAAGAHEAQAAHGTAQAEAVHACQAFAVTCLRVAWLLLGGLPPLALPPPMLPRDASWTGHRAEASGAATGSHDTSTPACASSSAGHSCPGVSEEVGGDHLDRITQLALAAIHVASAATVAGNKPHAAASAPVTDSTAGAVRVVSWGQVLAVVHAVHERASREGLAGWRRRGAKVLGLFAPANRDSMSKEVDEAGQAGEGREGGSDGVGCEDGAAGVPHGWVDPAAGHSGSSRGSVGSIDSNDGSGCKDGRGISGSRAGGCARQRGWRDIVAEERNPANQGLQQALAGVGVTVLMATWRQQQQQQLRRQQIKQGDENTVLFVSPECAIARIELLASMSYPFLATCYSLLPINPDFPMDLSAEANLAALARHSFVLLEAGSCVPRLAAPPSPCPPPQTLPSYEQKEEQVLRTKAAHAPVQGQRALPSSTIAQMQFANLLHSHGRHPQDEQQQQHHHHHHHHQCTSLRSLLAGLASEWGPVLGVEEQHAVAAIAGPLRGACSCVAHSPEERLRSLGYRSVHAVLDALPTGPRLALLQRMLLPHAAHCSCSELGGSVVCSTRPARASSSHIAPEAHPPAAQQFRHGAHLQELQPQLHLQASLGSLCLGNDQEGQHALLSPPGSPGTRARGGLETWEWCGNGSEPMSTLTQALPPEVAALLVQRLRKDVAAAAGVQRQRAVQRQKAVPLLHYHHHDHHHHHQQQQQQQQQQQVKTEQRAADGTNMLLGVVSNTCAPLKPLPLLASPWPLGLACLMLMDSLEAADTATVAHITQQAAGSTDMSGAMHVARGSKAPSSPVPYHPACTDPRSAGEVPGALGASMLCVRGPVPATADLCAACLSLVRLVALQARARRQHGLTQRSLSRPNDVTQAPSIAAVISAADALHAGSECGCEADEVRADVLCVQCVDRLCEEVLEPLCKWLQQRQADLQPGLEGEAPADVPWRRQGQPGLGAGALQQAAAAACLPGPSVGTCLEGTPPQAHVMAALWLPEDVAEYTALARLHEVASAVWELCEQLRGNTGRL